VKESGCGIDDFQSQSPSYEWGSFESSWRCEEDESLYSKSMSAGIEFKVLRRQLRYGNVRVGG